MGLKDTPYHMLSEQLPALDFIGSVPPILSESQGGFKNSNMTLLQSKAGHRKAVITVAFRRQDSGDSSTFIMPGSSVQLGLPDGL